MRSFPQLFAQVLILALVTTVIQACLPLGMKYLLQLSSQHPHQILVFSIGLAVYALILLSINLLDVLWYRTLDNFAGKYILKLTLHLEDKLAHTHGELIDELGHLKIHHIIYNDVLEVFRVVGHHAASLASSVIIVITALIITAGFNRSIAAILVCALIVGLIIAHYSRNVIKTASLEINRKMKEQSARCKEFAQRIDLIQSHNIEDYYYAKTAHAIHDFIDTSKRMDNRQVFLSNLVKHINMLFSLGLFAYVSFDPRNTLADMVFVMAVAVLVIEHTSRIDQLYYQILSSFGAFTQIDHLRSLSVKEGDQELADIQQLSFEGVSFSYPQVSHNILHNLSFTLNKGDCVRIEAPNGAGKSSVFKLIQHRYRASAGSITINGADIAGYRQRDLNTQIAYVGQNGSFVEDTVETHLKLLSGAQGDEAIHPAALEICHDITLNKPMEDNGQNLSGGQRQRVQIASLFNRLSSASLIILDEVDAGLDQEGLEIFYRHMQEIVNEKNKIILVVQHHSKHQLPCTKTITLPHL